MRKVSPEEIRSTKITNNETWNNCYNCGRNWKDKNNIPGLLHRTVICENCKQRMKTKDVTKH
jgi:uncharacterized CHY-type Zn-finger protein